jgi:hypothetical protein
MAALENFKDKNFTEQITILNELGNLEPTPERIRELVDLYLSPLGDKPVDAMVQHILSDLLSKNEKETVKRLTSDNMKVKRLSLQVAGRQQFKSAAPILVKMVSKEKDPMIVHEIFVTMSKLKTPGLLGTL